MLLLVLYMFKNFPFHKPIRSAVQNTKERGQWENSEVHTRNSDDILFCMKLSYEKVTEEVKRILFYMKWSYEEVTEEVKR